MDADVLKAIERDWKDGRLSPNLIRIKHGLSDTDQVLTLVARYGWGDRKSIQAKIQDGTLQALVQQSQPPSPADGELVDDDAQMSAYNQMVAGVIRGHHVGLGRGRQLADSMLAELEQIQPPKIDQDAIDSLAAMVEDENPELAEHLRAHVGPVSPKDKLFFLKHRISMLSELAGTQVTYIDAERKAYGLDNVANDQGTQFDDLIDGARKRVESQA